MGNRGFVGALLCGGKSRRMGADKAFLEVDGEVLWERGVRVLREAGAERVLVSANSGQVGRMRGELGDGVVLLEDLPGVSDPLSALVLCLGEAGGMPVVLLAVDMVGMTAVFLRGRLLGEGNRGRGTKDEDEGRFWEKGRFCLGMDGRVEPFGAVFPGGMLEVARRRVAAGDFSLTGCVKEGQGLGLMEEVRLEPGEEVFFANVNTPANLREIGYGRER